LLFESCFIQSVFDIFHCCFIHFRDELLRLIAFSNQLPHKNEFTLRQHRSLFKVRCVNFNRYFCRLCTEKLAVVTQIGFRFPLVHCSLGFCNTLSGIAKKWLGDIAIVEFCRVKLLFLRSTPTTVTFVSSLKLFGSFLVFYEFMKISTLLKAYNMLCGNVSFFRLNAPLWQLCFTYQTCFANSSCKRVKFCF